MTFACYYRSRGEGWQFHVARSDDVLLESDVFVYEERRYFFPDGGWVSSDVSELCIRAAVARFRTLPPSITEDRRADGHDFGADQSDAELAAIIRGAFERYQDQPSQDVELEAIVSAEVESADVYGVKGPGVVVLRVKFRDKRVVRNGT